MKVIVINGPMGVGKTTVGRFIAEKYPGTAFIDGDWCMDLHPFVGNRETKSMAVDNILHMIGNYQKCSACNMISTSISSNRKKGRTLEDSRPRPGRRSDSDRAWHGSEGVF